MDYSAYSDEALLQLCKTDQIALNTLAERYARLVRVCSRPFFLIGGDTEDLVQEGMIGLLTAIRQYRADSGTSFSAYAGICIRTRLISAVRAATAQKNAPLNNAISIQNVTFPDGTQCADPESVLIGKETLEELMQKSNRMLSAMERRVLALYLDGLSYGQIAKELQKTVKSVDNAVQRIRAKVARSLSER